LVKGFALGLRFLFIFGLPSGTEATKMAASLSLARLKAASPIN
tara:strand:- start:210 stop:338 length:129 start_codon:yes stop_codon:yes gene_type:complete